MEKVACDLCGSEDHEILFAANRKQWTSTIVRCKKCRLVYTNPRLESLELKQFYNAESYFTTVSKEDDKIGRNYVNIDIDKEMATERLSWLNLFKKPPGDFLEIGCATGTNLLAAKDSGWRTAGVEISEFAGTFARERLGLNVITGHLEDSGFFDESFDAVGMYQVLEHVPSPMEMLREVRRILKKGGILAVDVPDFGSRLSRKLGSHSPHLAPPEHIYHFTAGTLKALISKAGFEVLRLRRFGGGGTLFFEVSSGKKASGILPMLFNMRRLVYKSSKSKRLIRYFYWQLLRNNDFLHIIARKKEAEEIAQRR